METLDIKVTSHNIKRWDIVKKNMRNTFNNMSEVTKMLIDGGHCEEESKTMHQNLVEQLS